MHRPTVARAFLVFHLTLGTVVFAQSLRPAIEAAGTAFVMAHGRVPGSASARPA